MQPNLTFTHLSLSLSALVLGETPKAAHEEKELAKEDQDSVASTLIKVQNTYSHISSDSITKQMTRTSLKGQFHEQNPRVFVKVGLQYFRSKLRTAILFQILKTKLKSYDCLY